MMSAEMDDAQSKEDLKTIAREFLKDTKLKFTEQQVIEALRNFDPNDYSETSKRDTLAIQLHEWFAKGAESYFRGNIKAEGISEQLKAIFEAFKQMMLSAVNSLMQAGIPISQTMAEVYGRSFGPDVVSRIYTGNEVMQSAAADMRDRMNRLVANKSLNSLIGNLGKYDPMKGDLSEQMKGDKDIKIDEENKKGIFDNANEVDSQEKDIVNDFAMIATKLFNENKSDSVNIIRDLNAIVDNIEGMTKEKADYLKGIIARNESVFKNLDSPQAGMKRRQAIDKLLADPTIDEDLKVEVRKFRNMSDINAIRDYNVESLIEKIQDLEALTDLVGAEEMLIAIERGKVSPKSLIPLMGIVFRRLNGMIKELERSGRQNDANSLRNRQVDLVYKMAAETTARGRALSDVRALYMLDGAGRMIYMKRAFDAKNEKGKRVLGETFNSLKAQLDKVNAQLDEVVTKLIATEETEGELRERIRNLEMEVERAKASAAYKPTEKTGPAKPTKVPGQAPKKNPFKDKMSAALAEIELLKKSGKALFSIDPNAFTAVQVVAGSIMADNAMSISQFTKAMNKTLGLKGKDAKSEFDYRDLYAEMRDVLVNDGYDSSNYQSDAELNNEIDSIINSQQANVALKEFKLQQAREEAKYWKAREKEANMRIKLQKKLEKDAESIRNQTINEIGRLGLWDKYLNGIINSAIGNMTGTLGIKGKDKALLEEFSANVQNEIARMAKEAAPAADKQGKKAEKDYQQILKDLVNNQEKLKQAFDAAVNKFADENPSQEAQDLADKLRNKGIPLSSKSIKTAIEQNMERFKLNFRDLAFEYQGLSPVIKDQIIADLMYGMELNDNEKAAIKDAISKVYDNTIKEIKADAVSQVAKTVVTATQKVFSQADPKKKDFLDQMLINLKEKANTLLNEAKKNKLAEQGITPGKTALESLEFAANLIADTEGRKIWEGAKAVVFQSINDSETLTDEQKADMRDFLNDYQNTVFDIILPATKQYQAVKEVMLNSLDLTKINQKGERIIAWNKIILDGDGSIQSAKDVIGNAIMDKLPPGTDPALAARIVDSIVKRFEEEIERRKADIAEKQIKNAYDTLWGLKPKRKVVGRRNKAIELARLHSSGAFDRAATSQGEMDLISEYLGLRGIPQQAWDKLRQLSEKINDAPTGNIANLAIERLAAEMDKLIPGYGMRVGASMYVMNLLGSIPTMIKNSTGFMAPVRRALGFSLSDLDLNYLKIFAKGYTQGDFRDILLYGGMNQGTQLDTGVDASGMPIVRNMEYYTPGKYNPYGWLKSKMKYIGRLLDATDAANQRAVAEMAQYYLFKRELSRQGVSSVKKKAYELMYGTDMEKTWSDAVSQAIEDITNFDPTLLNAVTIKRQAWSVIREQRRIAEGVDEVIADAANEDALYSQYKTPLPNDMNAFSIAANPFSYGGKLLEKMFSGRDIDKLTETGSKRNLSLKFLNSVTKNWFAPFIRGVANFLNNSLHNTPYGVLKAGEFLMYNKDLNTPEGRVTRDLKVMQAKQLIMGNAVVYAALYGVAQALLMASREWDKEDENKDKPKTKITGSRQKEERGTKATSSIYPPNSITMFGKSFSFEWMGEYGLTLAVLANFNAVKENNERQKDAIDKRLFYLKEYVDANKEKAVDENLTVEEQAEIVQKLDNYGVEYESLKLKKDDIDKSFYADYGQSILDYVANLSFMKVYDKTKFDQLSTYERQLVSQVTNTTIPFVATGRQILDYNREVKYGDASQRAMNLSQQVYKQLGLGGWMIGKPTLDAFGDPLPAAVNSPASYGAFTQFQNPITMSPAKKWYMEEVNPIYAIRKADKLTYMGQAGLQQLSDEEHYEFTAKVLKANGAVAKYMYKFKDDRINRLDKEDKLYPARLWYRDEAQDVLQAIDNYFSYQYQNLPLVMTNKLSLQEFNDEVESLYDNIDGILEEYSPSVLKKQAPYLPKRALPAIERRDMLNSVGIYPKITKENLPILIKP